MQSLRRDRLVALALFLSLFLVVGAGFETTGAFFSPLLKEFGWSRTRLSLLSSALYGFGGLSTPLAGWLLDRIGARIVMIVSAMLTVAGLVLASQSRSFAPMFAAYLALGVAAVGGMFLPAAYVVTNQFTERRGLVTGIVMAGSALGGMAMNPFVGLMLPILGWRDTYRVLTLPILVIALPAILIQVRSHPSTEIKASGTPAAPGLSGLDLASASKAVHHRVFPTDPSNPFVAASDGAWRAVGWLLMPNCFGNDANHLSTWSAANIFEPAMPLVPLWSGRQTKRPNKR